MKRLFVFALIIVLCFTCVTSHAEETRKEITFQQIPWFSSPKDTIQALSDSGMINTGIIPCIEWFDREIKKFNNGEGHLYKSSFEYDDENPSAPYTTISYRAEHPYLSRKLQLLMISSAHIKKTIADQLIQSIDLYFTCEKGNPRFVECDIYFRDEQFDKDAVYAALVSAFGEPIATKYDGLMSIWMGENNTICIHSTISVCFASLDGLAQAESVIIETEEPVVENHDTGF